MSRPSIRRRLAVIAAAAVTVVAVSVGLLAWLALSQTLIRQVDRELQVMSHGPLPNLSAEAAATIPATPLDGDKEMRLQLRYPDGTRATVPHGTEPLPWSADDQAVAGGAKDSAVYTISTDDGRYRILTIRGNQGQTIQLARSLASTDGSLQRFGTVTATLILGAAAAAAFAGHVVARAGLRPIRQLTEAATHVAETRDLSSPIPTDGQDEVAQLGQAFNHMLDRLGDAQRQQRELIEDAAHELRTPMASLRTNVEFLIHAGDRLDKTDRTELLTDLDRQSVELAQLVGNLVDLARSRTVDEPATTIDLTDLAAEAVDLAEAHFPQTAYTLHAAQPVTVLAQPGALQRAVVNLLDNAAKFSRAGQTVDVHVEQRTTTSGEYADISIADRAPTIPADQRERIFQRFYRLDDARAVPGSGLGLAIVQQTATAHGGTVTVFARPGGGNVFTLTIRASPPTTT
ncbi:MAG: HAMP domain-containing histidine kinase [Hamadaea sp.]|uniref:HAMP domain-containing sensor histidine kinase n=1 Tax=Hamadaea sp. TaxID=2024425 RepID=UPI0017DB8ED1|nr:HAMP domain-containing sensor histidine kinase [Hamadaea sp.]NUR73819.1 HAMP domain-containing histidine kinase [Hamadaea sp.]NUT21067.1 HAMP domain-containing histidine kinase [Hamadaea sp.]